MATWDPKTKVGQCGQNWTDGTWKDLRVDPYLVWADITNFEDLGGELYKWFTVTIELKIGVTAAKFAEEMSKRDDNQANNKWIEIDRLYSAPPAALKDSTFCTAIVTTEFFKKVISDIKDSIERFEIGLAMVAKEYLTEPPPADYLSNVAHKKHGKATCVVGIVDDGLAFAHERFRYKNGDTRIDYLWDQRYFSPNVLPGNPSPMYGHEFTNKEIDGYVREASRGTFVDEDSIYRRTGYESVRRRIGHGTFVLDIACGEAPNTVTKNSGHPHIIGVQLQAPSRKTRDRASGWLTARVLDGLRYILDRAEKVAPGCPVFINLSFGNIAGPHDGSSMLEKAIDELIERRSKIKVIIAAGNSNLTRCHAQFDLTGKTPKSIDWRILPDDPTPNFLEIWLPEADLKKSPPSQVELQITTPSGEVISWIGKNNICQWPASGAALCSIVYLNKVSSGDKNMILVAVAPTYSHDTKRAVAPAGTWKIELRNRGATGELHISAWIQRDETPFDFPRHARQSRFNDPKYQRFDKYGHLKDDDTGNEDSYIKRLGTINSIATGKLVEVIGGYRRSDGTTARYSSSGPTTPACGKLAPDGAGVCEDSVTCHGILSSGARSGSVVAMNGTSVAAPQVTRWHVENGKLATPLHKPDPKGSATTPLDLDITLATLAQQNEAELQKAKAKLSSRSPQRKELERLRKEREGHGRIKFDRETAARNENGGGRQFRR